MRTRLLAPTDASIRVLTKFLIIPLNTATVPECSHVLELCLHLPQTALTLTE